MVAERLGRLAARLVNAIEPTAQRVNSSEFAKRLRDEFERGRSGAADEAATESARPTDGATGGETVATDATGVQSAGAADSSGTQAEGTGTQDSATRPTDTGSTDTLTGGDESPGASDEDSVVAALRAVDWSKVRTATSERSSAAAQRMREMAGDVDWGRVQAGAAVVSSALIAAVASGQVPLGGRLAGPVARAILNDADLGARVNSRLKGDAAPPDLRNEVRPDTTAG